MLKIGHSVTRPGRVYGGRDGDDRCSRGAGKRFQGSCKSPGRWTSTAEKTPWGVFAVDNTANTYWLLSEWGDEQRLEFKLDYAMNLPIIKESLESGEVEPTSRPEPGKDVTAEIKRKAQGAGVRRGRDHPV